MKYLIRTCLAGRAKPTLVDFVFIALLLWLVVYTWAGGSPSLLHDAGTGVHIRTGEYILDHRSVPHTDIFSFSHAGRPWFAWEWLADLGMAILFRAFGLKGVALAAAIAIALAFAVSIRHAVEAGANPLVAIAVLHVGIGAASQHFLARPYALTLLLMAIGWRLLDRDSGRHSVRIWILVPLTALWVNLHGGFTALLVSLAVFAVGCLFEERARALRCGGLCVACTAAALFNPYGLGLYGHLAGYLRAGWVRELVEEFRPPDFTSGGIYLELLLFASLGTAALLAVRGRYAHALLIAAWAHAALLSVRYMPMLFFVAAPSISVEVSAVWREDFAPTLRAVGETYRAGFSRLSLWGPLVAICLLLPGVSVLWPGDFPAERYPADVVRTDRKMLTGARVLTTDSWADYLIYQLYPRQKVFFDGRTDFYGERFTRDYVALIQGDEGWRERLRKGSFDAVLLPPGARITGLISREPGWSMRVCRPDAVLLTRSHQTMR